VTLGTVIDTAFTVFESDPTFRRRRLLRPQPCDADSFHDLVTAARGFKDGPLNDALLSVAPFADQLYLPKHFHTDALPIAWPDHSARAADGAGLVHAVCSRLVASRWGRRGGAHDW
jgi:hypothetical protein